MKNKKMKTFVYMAIHSKQKGITFVSVLFSLTILATTLPFLAFVFQSLPQNSSYEEFSVRHFFHVLRNELYTSETLTIDSSDITLHHLDGSKTTIELYKDLIRRQVSGKGHEIIVRDIQQLEFKKLPYGVRASIVTSKEETYEKNFTSY